MLCCILIPFSLAKQFFYVIMNKLHKILLYQLRYLAKLGKKLVASNKTCRTTQLNFP